MIPGPRSLFPAAGAIVLGASLLLERWAVGPFFLHINADPSYLYLLLGTKLLSLHHVPFSVHPGIPLSMMTSALVALFTWLAPAPGTPPLDVAAEVWTAALRSEAILRCAFDLLVGAFVASAWWSARVATESTVERAVFLLSFLLIPDWLLFARAVSPELMLLSIGVAFSAILLRAVDRCESWHAWALGALAGLAICTKVTCALLPFVAVPVLRRSPGALRRFFPALLLGLAPVLLLGPGLVELTTWLSGVITHAGPYGTGAETGANLAARLLAGTPLLLRERWATLVFLVGAGLALRRDQAGPERSGRTALVILAFFVVQHVLAYGFGNLYGERRYLVPAFLLLPALCVLLWRHVRAPNMRALLAAALFFGASKTQAVQIQFERRLAHELRQLEAVPPSPGYRPVDYGLASTPAYALFTGAEQAGDFQFELARIHPDKLFLRYQPEYKFRSVNVAHDIHRARPETFDHQPVSAGKFRLRGFTIGNEEKARYSDLAAVLETTTEAIYDWNLR